MHEYGGQTTLRFIKVKKSNKTNKETEGYTHNSDFHVNSTL